MTSANRNDMESWYKLKVQEIQTQSARQTMEQGYQREEVKRLRVQLGDLRGKLADLEGRVSSLVSILDLESSAVTCTTIWPTIWSRLVAVSKKNYPSVQQTSSSAFFGKKKCRGVFEWKQLSRKNSKFEGLELGKRKFRDVFFFFNSGNNYDELCRTRCWRNRSRNWTSNLKTISVRMKQRWTTATHKFARCAKNVKLSWLNCKCYSIPSK